ncbi:unnamed protein product [Psylliodes chrysocephalus]|uniref:Uncharacterized protein n=1 Tax=Psylliodes chrysocephalus TaxID=3402493 RepID=A0A9P0GJ68_9CUCU|nr:unnamed protein product [Psylliodes chrysocephala]
MSVMVLPELWSKSSNFSLLVAIAHLKKYSHLLNWKKQESILEFGFANGYNSCRSLVPLLPNDYKEFFGGSMFVTFFERTPIGDIVLRMTKYPKWNKYDHEEMISTYYYSQDPRKEYERDLEAANFENYVFNVETESYEYSSEEEFDSRFIDRCKWSTTENS